MAGRDPVRPAGVPDDAVLRVFRVPAEAAGMRVDVFLSAQLRNTSRTRAGVIARTTAYSTEGRRLRPSERLRAEEQVALWRPPFDADVPLPELRILHEDPHLLVVDKPPLVTVHPTAREHRNTLIKRLESARPGEYLSLIHRLDRETSGILLVARTPEADRAFKRLLEDRSAVEMQRGLATRASERDEGPRAHLWRHRQDERDRRDALALLGGARPQDDSKLAHQLAQAVRRAADVTLIKEYRALTWGTPPEGNVELPLELDPVNPLRVKMRVAAPGTGLDARTAVRVLEVRGGYALVECTLHTGRQHQIRAHLAALGTPVVGDKLYGPDERLHARGADGELTAEDLERLELPRQALHASRYALPHAITGEWLDLHAPLPPDLQAFWDRCGAEAPAAAPAG